MVTNDDHASICAFCAEANSREQFNAYHNLDILPTDDYSYILEETSRFVVIPCIGPLTDNYVLIVPKRHVLSMGWLTAEELTEVETLTQRWSHLVAGPQESALILEHGSLSFRDKGGACYDHAHLHIVGSSVSLDTVRSQLSEHIRLSHQDDWSDSVRDFIQSRSRSYVLLRSGEDCWIGDAHGAPPQFFRKALCLALGLDEGAWDWLLYPRRDAVRAMIARYAAH